MTVSPSLLVLALAAGVAFPAQAQGRDKLVPLSPQRIEISKDGKFAYVLTRMGGQEGGVEKASPVLFAMPITDKHDASRFIRVGQAPWGLAQSDDGTRLYVSSNSDSTITVIDGSTLKVLATVPVVKDPQALAFRP